MDSEENSFFSLSLVKNFFAKERKGEIEGLDAEERLKFTKKSFVKKITRGLVETFGVLF